MDSLISTFHLDWKLMVAQAINFGIVILVLYFFALKPLKKMMDERGATIEGGLNNAKKQEELLKNAQAEYEAMIAKANSDASLKMKEAKNDAEAKAAQMMEKAQADVAAVIAAGKVQLEAEKATMMQEAKKELTALVVSATEKVLGGVVTEKIDAKIVEESIKQL
jgi:F-type H+-transporting ATPase subunit b